MKKLLLLLWILLCSVFNANSQGEAANWFFGGGAGLVFDVANGTVNPSSEAQNTINTNEGCSSISAPDGTLLFYTDGRTVWDANHQIMPNANYNAGSGLLGDPSSTSSGVIVPHPGNSDLYYIFTVDEPHHNNAWAFPNQGPADSDGNPIDTYEETFGNFQVVPQDDDGFNNGFNYSLVDMSLNGGMGDVVPNEKNIHLITYDVDDPEQSLYKCAEKITAVQGADCDSYWVITQFVDTFYVFQITTTGINTTPITSTLDPFITTEGYRRNGIGYIKSSPDGTKIAVCHSQNSSLPSDTNTSPQTGSLWLYDFDDATGIVSNPVNLGLNIRSYGTEFSADSKKLYFTNNNQVRQFDLDNNNAEAIVFQGDQNAFISSMQLGPDNKIYVCNSSNNGNSLDVIQNPDAIGINCNYTQGGQPLAAGTSATLGLPPFITSFLLSRQINIIDPTTDQVFNDLDICGQMSYILVAEDIPGATYNWFRDGLLLTESDFDLEVSQAGVYEVIIDNIPDECNLTIIGEANVEFHEIPTIANLPLDIEVCDDDNNNTWSFDLDIQDAGILGSQDANVFSIDYYESLEDATNRNNPISGNYSNTSSPQEIFVRIENTNNPSCFEIASFFLRVFNTPIASSINAIEVCDDANDGSNTNGQVTTLLTTLTPTILNGQNTLDYSVTYHLSQSDADNRLDAQPISFYNPTPFNQTLFARIENRDYTDCYSTIAFDLIVNPIPEAFNSSLLQCDDTGIPDGFTIFNLTQAHDALVGNASDRNTQFYASLNDAELDSNAINANSYANTTNPQTLFVRVIDASSGCYTIAELELMVSTTAANDATIEVCDDDGTEDGLHSFNLSDANTSVLTGINTNLSITYYASYQEALLETQPLPNNYTNTTPYSQIVYARVEDDNACYGINEVELIVHTLPHLEDDTSLLYCLNFYPELITLNAGVIGDLPNNYYYNWSTNETTYEIQVNEIGTYTVTVTNTNGCSKTRTITVVPSNIATIDTIDIADASTNNIVTINASGEGDYEYALNSENGPYQDSPIFENVPPGLHTVYVRDKNNCGIVEDAISVIGFPKFFTPNGDAHNPTWHVYGINTPNQVRSKIHIFDRFGKLITQLDPQGPGWDGTYNGRNMPSNDYWFYVILQDGREFRSHFTLKR